MENVNCDEDIPTLLDNKIQGNPNLINSKISFNGKNNILYCEPNINIVNSHIKFLGNDSLIYLSSNKNNYPLNIQIFQDSVIFMGKDNILSAPVSMDVQEHKNLIIGDECIIGSNTTFKTSDGHIIYDSDSKKRINHSKSIYIGDHVWIGHQSYICKGTLVGSGAILENNSYVSSNSIIKSNNLYGGNPLQLIRENVFFTNEYTGNFTEEDSLNFNEYNSRLFLFLKDSSDTLDFYKIDEILNSFDIYQKIDFIQKLFIQNKKLNRFSI